MYDLAKAKQESGLKDEQLARLEAQVRAEFSTDDMMFELHLIRVLEAIQKGWITVGQALEIPATQA